MTITVNSNLFSRSFGALLLAAAISCPMLAQDAQPSSAPDSATTSAVQSQPALASQPQASSSRMNNAGKEGFWGHLNPFARKKWVKKQTDPLKDHLGELDEVNAKNAKDIQDVDGRAQAGIQRAQTAADKANQIATTAATNAQQAAETARTADGRVTALGNKVDGLDQYSSMGPATEIQFRNGSPILSTSARKELDELADSVNGKQGYIIEVEGHSPIAGSAGIQSSSRMNEAVKRYLCTKHEIPVYRLHTVALGNALNATEGTPKHARVSSVHVQILQNSLGTETTPAPSGMAQSMRPERP